MTPEEFEMCWVPVPLCWRHVVPNDVIVTKGGTPWIVVSAGSGPGTEYRVLIVSGRRNEWHGPVDPDEVVQVLTPWPMAQAVALTRDELGARLLERRTTTEGAA